MARILNATRKEWTTGDPPVLRISTTILRDKITYDVVTDYGRVGNEELDDYRLNCNKGVNCMTRLFYVMMGKQSAEKKRVKYIWVSSETEAELKHDKRVEIFMETGNLENSDELDGQDGYEGWLDPGFRFD